MILSEHALSRWQERFGGDEAEMREAIGRSIPWAGQLGTGRLYLDEVTRAVFVVARGEVKTVLTERMAVVNQQGYIKQARYCDYDTGLVGCAEAARRFELKVQAAELKRLAERHATTYRHLDQTGDGFRNERLADFRELGFAARSPQWGTYEQMYIEAIRNHYGKATLQP